MPRDGTKLALFIDGANLYAAAKTLGFAIDSGILILAVSSAIAQEHHHPPQDQTIHERFYSTWMMPDNRNISCCHNVDCSPAETRLENGHWIARKVGDEGDWITVPPQKVEHDRESPDGRSHLCSRLTGTNDIGNELP